LALPYLLSAFNQTTTDPRPGRYLLATYEHIGDIKNVKQVLEMLLQRNPADLNSRTYLADVYYRLMDYPQAEAQYRLIMEAKPDPLTRGKLAEVLIWQEKYKEGIAELEVVAKEFPRNPKILELLADAYSWAGAYQQSADVYKQLLQLNVRHKEIVLKLADVLRYLGKDEEALELYDKYIQ